MSSITAVNTTQPRLNPYQKERKIVAALQGYIRAENARLVFQYTFVFSKTVVVYNTADFILFCPPPGRPDPREACTAETLECDTRRRIAAKITKINACFYYACNIIRQRIGPCRYSPDLAEARQVELRALALFNENKKIGLPPTQAAIQTLRALISNPDNRSLLNISKKAAKQLPRKQYEQEVELAEKTKIKISRPSVIYGALFKLGILDRFISQNLFANFLDFLKDTIQARPKLLNHDANLANVNFMEAFDLKAKDQFEAICQQDPIGFYAPFKGRWEKLPAGVLRVLTHSLALDTIARCYGLLPATWTPFQSANELFNQLKEKGPILVAGCFKRSQDLVSSRMQTKHGAVALGRAHFDTELIEVAESFSKKEISTNRGHCVVIVGVKKQNNEATVYFIDPTNPSDPFAKVVMTIYMMAYQDFTQKVTNPKTGVVEPIALTPTSYYGYSARHFSLSKCQ